MVLLLQHTIFIIISLICWYSLSSLQRVTKLPTSVVPHVSQSLSIPNRLVFTYRYNFFDEPIRLEGKQTDNFKATYNNVFNTIRLYNSSFHGNAEVVFLDNQRCRRIIDETYPRLTRYFDIERGKFKSDICRISELYLRGGYYFDVDLEALIPFKIPSDVTFATVQTEQSGIFFQAFLASTPGNAILMKAMDVMLEYYESKSIAPDDLCLMGPKTLTVAFLNLTDYEKGKFILLSEVNLESTNHSHNVKLRSGAGGACNYVVCDPKQCNKTLYFYSRFVGASRYCYKVGEK